MVLYAFLSPLKLLSVYFSHYTDSMPGYTDPERHSYPHIYYVQKVSIISLGKLLISKLNTN